MKIILFCLLVLGAITGSIFVATALFFGGGAPQQAALAAIACAVTIIPYCMLKGVAEMSKGKYLKEN